MIEPFFSRKKRKSDIDKAPNRQGVYILYQNGHRVYIGETNKIKTRIKQHIRDPPRGKDFDHFIYSLTPGRAVNDRKLKEKRLIIHKKPCRNIIYNS